MKYFIAFSTLACLAASTYYFFNNDILKSILFILLAWMNMWALRETRKEQQQP